MPEFLSLRGRNALSDFRLSKLLSNLENSAPAITGLSAEYRHFVELSRPLTAERRRVLERVLSYGPAAGASSPGGTLLLVVPRLGTISPWSSKATDIAHSCGLPEVLRIERGVAFRVRKRGSAKLSEGEREALLPLIHDRMTETVLA